MTGTTLAIVVPLNDLKEYAILARSTDPRHQQAALAYLASIFASGRRVVV